MKNCYAVIAQLILHSSFLVLHFINGSVRLRNRSHRHSRFHSLSHPQPQPSPLIIFTSSWISSLVAGRLSMTSPSKNRSAPANGWLRSTITTSCWISTTLAFTRWPSPVIKGTMLPSCTRSLSNLPSISKICLGRSNTCCSSYAPYALSAGMVKSNLSPLERVVIWFSKGFRALCLILK